MTTNVTVQLNTRVPKALHTATKIACIETDVTMEQWIREALERALREKRRTA